MEYLQRVKIVLIYGTFQRRPHVHRADTVDVYTRLEPEVGYRVIKHVSVVKFRKIVSRNANKIDVIRLLIEYGAFESHLWAARRWMMSKIEAIEEH